MQLAFILLTLLNQNFKLIPQLILVLKDLLIALDKLCLLLELKAFIEVLLLVLLELFLLRLVDFTFLKKSGILWLISIKIIEVKSNQKIIESVNNNKNEFKNIFLYI
jgi:hypothetical protein